MKQKPIETMLTLLFTVALSVLMVIAFLGSIAIVDGMAMQSRIDDLEAIIGQHGIEVPK